MIVYHIIPVSELQPVDQSAQTLCPPTVVYAGAMAPQQMRYHAHCALAVPLLCCEVRPIVESAAHFVPEELLSLPLIPKDCYNIDFIAIKNIFIFEIDY